MEKQNIPRGDKSYIGKTVSVTVDRPIGTEHPKHPGLIYPINYGYVDNFIGGDGEEQDVYILGIDTPRTKVECVIIAVIMRKDDNEDKWVGVPRELVGTDICYECNIVKAVEFQERYYTSEIFALYEKTCGAVIFTELDNERKYLIIKNLSGHVGFPKGHVEYGESETDTALREVFEETGLKVSLKRDFREQYTFDTLDGTVKTSVFYLGEFDRESALKIQQEEVIGDWLLDYSSAMEKLNWENDRKIFRKVSEYFSGFDNK